MWKQFTREKPARAGWTLGTMFLAFIGTLGVAGLLVDVKTLAGRQVNPRWPIAFTLPGQYRWSLDLGHSVLGSAARDHAGTAAYVGTSPEQGRCELIVTFDAQPRGSGLPVRTGESPWANLTGGEQISLGPLPGLMASWRLGDGRTRMVAGTRSPENLEIAIVFAADERSGREKAIFESICDSIELLHETLDE